MLNISNRQSFLTPKLFNIQINPLLRDWLYQYIRTEFSNMGYKPSETNIDVEQSWKKREKKW